MPIWQAGAAQLAGCQQKGHLAQFNGGTGKVAVEASVARCRADYPGKDACLPKAGCKSAAPGEADGRQAKGHEAKLEQRQIPRPCRWAGGKAPAERGRIAGSDYAKGKRCIGYKTDVRSFIGGFDNVMLCGAPETVLRSERELREYFAPEDGPAGL